MPLDRSNRSRLAQMLERAPYTCGGIALAWAAFGNFLPRPEFDVLRWCCGCIAVAFLALVFAKMAAFPHSLASAKGNPVLWAGFATIYMALMVCSTYLVDIQPQIALAVWTAALGAHFCHMADYSITHLPRMTMENLHATILIVYVGIAIAAVTAPLHHQERIGLLVLALAGIGLCIFVPLLVWRYLRRRRVPDRLAPAFCVLAAPFSLVTAGYICCMDAPDELFIGILGVICTVFYVVVLSRVPGIIARSREFSPTLACLSFPFTISARASRWLSIAFATLGSPSDACFYQVLFIVQVAIAFCLICYASVRFAREILKGGHAAKAF
ncbi:hypothetical protein [Curtanaerobium respiraculi]|uniref:SLAC1 family transporter n=1 Tax=Curtanaerobium respiraculi TaxID=2949669 RepID=UPI0024B39A57|nr:hypothetical protein [Curtanaerobium respiraculi]